MTYTNNSTTWDNNIRTIISTNADDEVVHKNVYIPTKQLSYTESYFTGKRKKGDLHIKSSSFSTPSYCVSLQVSVVTELVKKISVQCFKSNSSFMIYLNHKTKTAIARDKRNNTMLPTISKESLYSQLVEITVPLEEDSVSFLRMMFI